MEKLNFSEKIITPFRSGGLGNVAVAYLMYKLATPARYTVTIGGTNLAIRYVAIYKNPVTVSIYTHENVWPVPSLKIICPCLCSQEMIRFTL